MKRLAAFLILLLLLAPFALSQEGNQDSTSKPCNPELTAGPAGTDPCLQQQAENQQPNDPNAPNAPAPKPVSANSTYTPAVNGGPAILVQEPQHFRLLYGAATTQGYDSSVASPFNPIDSYFGTYEGYIAATWQFTRNYIVLQQDSIYTAFGSDVVEGSSFHHTAAIASGEFNPNLGWLLEAHSQVGDNSLTLLNPLPGTIIGGVTVTSPSSVLVGSNEGFVWGTDVIGTLNWKVNRRNSFSFRAENANRQFYDLDLHDNQAIFELQYKRALSERTYVGAYGITRHQTGDILCDNVGFGLLASTRPSERLILEASGGPEWDSSGCRRHQGFDLHFSGAYRLHPRVWGFLMANRQYSSGFLPNGVWEDNIGAGFSSRLKKNLTWEVSGGYLQGYTVGFILPPTTIGSYHGFYAETRFIERLSSAFTLEEAYRRFDSTSAGLTGHRNVFFVTLRWSPRKHDAWRTEKYPYPQTEPIDKGTRSDRDQ